MNSVLLVEGYHEKLFIEDFIQNHGELSFKYDKEVKKIDASNIKTIYTAYYKIDVYFVVDKDVAYVNKEIEHVKRLNRKHSNKFVPIVQDPEFNSFCASFFSDFHIQTDWTSEKVKAEAVKVLTKGERKNVNLKEWTYTEIIKHGGTIHNAKRYEKRFEMFKHLRLHSND